jgi:ATPase subunit of ABC transporter with duplicated ATPase domains
LNHWLRHTIDKQLKDIPKSKIREQLLEVGFDDDRQAELVSGLSGGWKMKLELARAMLYNADLLLLDEVRRPILPNFHILKDNPAY